MAVNSTVGLAKLPHTRCQFAGAVIGQLGAGGAADVHVYTFEGAANFHGGGGAQRAVFQRQEAPLQGRSVAQGLFSGMKDVKSTCRVNW